MLNAGLATYGQSLLATIIYPNRFLFHNGNQDVQWWRSNGARWNVLLIGEWARLISSRQRRLRNGQRNRVLFHNLRGVIRPFGVRISVLQSILPIFPTTTFPTPREQLSKNLLKQKVFPEPTCTHCPQGSLCQGHSTHNAPSELKTRKSS